MKILSLSNSPLEETQGSGYVITGYARRLRALGHEVDLLGPDEIEIPRGGSRAHSYRQTLGMAVHALRRLRRGYDVYEFYGGEAWLAISLVRKARNRPLLVAHSNGLEPHVVQRMNHAMRANSAQVPRRWYQAELSGLYARGFRLADALVTVGEFDRAYALQARYLPPARVLAIENPLPDSYLNQPLVHDRPPTAVFCGSWIPRKGTALLVREAGVFLEAHPEWKLVLVGVGDAFRAGDYLPSRVADRIDVVPSTDRERGLREIYLRSRVAIQTSIYESFGLAAAEAMACGCALAASRVGFADALTDGEDALLFPSADNPGLGTCLARLARDEPLRRRIAANGHRRVQGLRWDEAARRLEAGYRSWLNEHRRRSRAAS
jgi:glycosyltransferase involved in cell wall biosynthesis